MQSQINELDWKLFRSKLPEWQEAYMLRLNIGYAALLAGSGKASDKFWELDAGSSSLPTRTKKAVFYRKKP